MEGPSRSKKEDEIEINESQTCPRCCQAASCVAPHAIGRMSPHIADAEPLAAPLGATHVAASHVTMFFFWVDLFSYKLSHVVRTYFNSICVWMLYACQGATMSSLAQFVITRICVDYAVLYDLAFRWPKASAYVPFWNPLWWCDFNTAPINDYSTSFFLNYWIIYN